MGCTVSHLQWTRMGPWLLALYGTCCRTCCTKLIKSSVPSGQPWSGHVVKCICLTVLCLSPWNKQTDYVNWYNLKKTWKIQNKNQFAEQTTSTRWNIIFWRHNLIEPSFAMLVFMTRRCPRSIKVMALLFLDSKNLSLYSLLRFL